MMKNKERKLIEKANGMKFEITFDTTKAAKEFYRKAKGELNEEKLPVTGKISFKCKGKKVIFKGNRAVVVDILTYATQ